MAMSGVPKLVGPRAMDGDSTGAQPENSLLLALHTKKVIIKLPK